MGRVHQSRQAEIDLWEIAEYIATDKPSAAARFLDEVSETIELIRQFPRMGRMRDELLPGLRSLPVGNYIIFYRERNDTVEIVRVIHGARDIDDLFGL